MYCFKTSLCHFLFSKNTFLQNYVIFVTVANVYKKLFFKALKLKFMFKKNYFTLYFFMFLFSNCQYLKAVRPEIRLDAAPMNFELSGWQFRQVGKEKWADAKVPGCVHTDLLSQKMIEDPFFGDNEKKLQWIERESWEYKTYFDVSPEVLLNSHIELDFKGLDTYAEVFLNGKSILLADNMFRSWQVDCKRFLKNTSNELRIKFTAPDSIESKKWATLGYELPGGKRVMTRKAQYHYGWDWGPRFVTFGIWRPIEFRAWNEAKLVEFNLHQLHLDDGLATVRASIAIESATNTEALLTLHIDNQDVEKKITLSAGTNNFNLDADIQQPRRWWSVGLGKQNMYQGAVDLKISDRVLGSLKKNIGLRTIDLMLEKDGKGETFYFKLNGVPVFMKGANYIPQESFYSRLTDESYEKVIEQAAAANMNMLRVWGGGVYENDIFYDICDRKGILVWQDFMFACAMYPGDAAFMKNVENEAIENVKRLRTHPCIALWCGNNENNEGWQRWGWQMGFKKASQKNKVWEDYQALFNNLLPNIVKKYANGVDYWESSPRFGRGDARSATEGDSHYWGVWHDAEPFSILEEKIPRFMSEYGFQSFPERRTVAKFAQPKDWKIDSDAMLNHQKHPRGNSLVNEYMERDYREPKDFESFLYLSQLLQAEGMRVGIEAQRRAMPYCMGTLYWQLNDCWPVVSWSSMDYYGNWKAMHYFVKKSYAPTLVAPYIEDKKFKIKVVSDRLVTEQATLHFRLMDFAGNMVLDTSQIVDIQPNSSHLLYEKSVEDLVGGKSWFDVVAHIALTNTIDSSILSEKTFFFGAPRDLTLPLVNIEKDLKATAGGYLIRIKTDRLAKNIQLETDLNGHFEDNYFDLLPKSSTTIFFKTQEKTDEPNAAFRLKTLVDTYR